MSDVRPFFDATEIAGDGDAARSRFDRDGYLFVRGLMPPPVVEDLRRQFLAVLRDADWIAADSPPDDQVAELSAFAVEPEPAYQKVYNQLYRLPAFHALQHRAELLDLIGAVLDAPVIPQPRVIARVLFPGRTAHTTPAHQDFVPVQGAADTITAWIPLTDLSPEMGGLQIAAGTHRKGVFDFVPALGAGGTEITDPLHGAWVGGTFQQGDVLFFHSMTVHRGAPATGARLRLSVDLRFQRLADPIAPGSLKPHDPDVTWEQIYEGWAPGQHQYFWRDWDLDVAEFDTRYNEKRDAMAFELAAKGDAEARATLLRIVARDPDPAKQRKAAEALAALDADTA
ncbi:MAG: phytanoyl-CoA dioxygenase family protein [Chloroflexi bacterium]|nr:phytanoyl-CoA dioxygenase family protein [Chloroflexota bacterium]